MRAALHTHSEGCLKMNRLLKLGATIQKSQAVYWGKTMKHVIKGLVQVLMIGTMGLILTAPASADPIYIENSGAISQSWAMGGSDYTRWGYDYPWSVGWTQTGTYSNVSISADVNVADTGSWFLTTQVGAGTTVADEIASGTFGPVPNSFSNPFPNWVTMVTGLTLGPGTYYLTLDDPYGGGWRFDSSIAPTLGSGVTAAGDSYGYCDPSTLCDAYAPANTGNLYPAGLRVDVEGTTVPEPSSLFLVGIGLLGLGGTVKRKFFS